MSQSTKLSDEELLSKLANDFHELVNNEEDLGKAISNFFDNLIGDLTLGVIFEIHRKFKTKTFDLLEEEEEIDENATTDAEIAQELKKVQECVCPNCGKVVGCARFAPHLEKCLGMSKTRSRNSTRRVASSSSKDRESTTYSGVPSDDEDDIDWNSGNKRGKKKKRNGNKKAKGNTKKLDSSGADFEVDEEDTTNLKELQDNSNSSANVDSNGQQPSTSKKKDKFKNKKNNKKDRSSPSLNTSVD